MALRPYLSGELMVAQAETPKKKSRKSIPENKKYKKRAKPDEEEEDQQNEIIEFVEEEEEEEAEIEVVPPGGHLSSGVLTSEQNKIRENIAKTKLVRKGQLFHLPICSIHRPPVDPESGRRPLEIREPHAVHVQNLKSVKSVVRKQMKTENREQRIRRFNGSLESRTVRGRERE